MAVKKSVQAADMEENCPTGIAELDSALQGGFPRGSVVLLAGSSGSGKTMLSLQWLFDGVKRGENCMYISLTEPLFKIVKNLEAMDFYDRKAIEDQRLKIIDIRVMYGDQFYGEKVMEFVEDQVKSANIKRVCIDSITAIAYNLKDKAEVRKLIFELGRILTSLGCTTVLTSEIVDTKERYSVYGVEEFISDAIIKLDQVRVGDEFQRILQIIKVRGRGYSSEDRYFRITPGGITVFPKVKMPLGYPSTMERVSTGNAVLDQMLGGGLFSASSTILAGTAGTGKSMLALQFLSDGLKQGVPCLYGSFEESREQVLRNAKSCGWDFGTYEKEGLLTLRCVYPTEKFMDEHLAEIQAIVERKGIKRCAIDPLSAIASAFPEDSYVNFAKRLNNYMKARGVTTMFTSSVHPDADGRGRGDRHLSTTVDNLITLRQVEMEGELQPVLNVVKERGSTHSKELRRYDITGDGIVIGSSLAGYEAVITGVGRKVSQTVEEKLEAEFKRFLGPMGAQAFGELSESGVSEEGIDAYIDSLVRGHILRAEDGGPFKDSVSAILQGEGGLPPKLAKKKKGVLGGLLGGGRP
ncbi:MAG: ATPase domain-containing protein [Candidatus ainarchaeum sp.]|nr:ATPase domain-containing protein [Candidatus ainarchaeum sp.]